MKIFLNPSINGLVKDHIKFDDPYLLKNLGLLKCSIRYIMRNCIKSTSLIKADYLTLSHHYFKDE